LHRLLSRAQVRQVATGSPVPEEVFPFGSLYIMADDRCHLSSYATGESPNLCRDCQPARAVRCSEEPEGLTSPLNDTPIDSYA
ncbi:U32 family peptidase, partial [Pseudomonas aeruginosa]